jgi:hypothetical protein
MMARQQQAKSGILKSPMEIIGGFYITREEGLRGSQLLRILTRLE